MLNIRSVFMAEDAALRLNISQQITDRIKILGVLRCQLQLE
ncbi:hypothetical protein BDGGKGIB_00377 [Nodularia sphaerocarpa UHCC 0038]|nr:hypothetical protein BDGGKGIB_00377 [Nodularia sphaerocarpa UHCC 0038]